MADNFVANPGAGGDTFAADDVAGIKYPRSKISFGIDGAATDVSATDPLPVTMTNTLALTDTQLRATPVPVSGTVTANTGLAQPLTDTQLRASAVPVTLSGVATETTLAALNTKMPAQGQALMAASSPVVIASNQSALPVTGTFFQATQPVSAVSLPLPTGASTETTLAALNAKVTAVNTGAVGACCWCCGYRFDHQHFVWCDSGNTSQLADDSNASGRQRGDTLVYSNFRRHEQPCNQGGINGCGGN